MHDEARAGTEERRASCCPWLKKKLGPNSTRSTEAAGAARPRGGPETAEVAPPAWSGGGESVAQGSQSCQTRLCFCIWDIGQPSETVFKKAPCVFIPVKALRLLGRSRPGCVSWSGVLVDLKKASERTPTVPGFRPIFHPSKLSNKKFTSMTPRLLLDAYLTGQVVSHRVIWNHQRSHLLPSQLSSDRTGSYLAFFPNIAVYF